MLGRFSHDSGQGNDGEARKQEDEELAPMKELSGHGERNEYEKNLQQILEREERPAGRRGSGRRFHGGRENNFTGEIRGEASRRAAAFVLLNERKDGRWTGPSNPTSSAPLASDHPRRPGSIENWLRSQIACAPVLSKRCSASSI